MCMCVCVCGGLCVCVCACLFISHLSFCFQTQSLTKTSPSTQWRHSVACDSLGSYTGSRPPSKTILLQQQVNDEVVRNLVENRSCFSKNYNTSSQTSQLSLESIPEPGEVGY